MGWMRFRETFVVSRYLMRAARQLLLVVTRLEISRGRGVTPPRATDAAPPRVSFLSRAMLRQTTRAVAGHAMRVSERAPAMGPHGGFAAMGARHIGKVGVPENYGQIDSVGTDFLGTPKNHREVRARSLRPAPPRTRTRTRATRTRTQTSVPRARNASRG